ncbi:unnamed protein product [Rotaria socialis]|uniref:BED-type domain-containing protein n=3 Tax=Rotaria socialis TaxID=392032 RepID=A0A821YDZ2_9BILA|nr:unnamed protein product [Rotaria socialis]CAF4563238.1 unnamed protein product [Rotaria socialis]CAF4963392.1 unnamed protein product [Rotaria socialis]
MNVLLKKNEIIDLIKQQDESVIFQKPKQTSKSSSVWEHFSLIVVNKIKQEMIICDNCKDLLTYRQKDGTTSMAKHFRSCHSDAANARSCLNKQTKVTEYYASSQTLTIPKKIKEKVKIACTEFTALDCRAFEVVSGEGFYEIGTIYF